MLEGDALWVRVIKSIHGESGGLEVDGVGSRVGRSGLWRDIVKVGLDIEKVGIEFSSSFSKNLGDGGDTLFWEDRWVGGIRLRERFPRLFQLDRHKEARVVDRGRWCEGVWRWEWDWVREPRGRASGDVVELTRLLQNVILSLDCRDSWRWNLSEDCNFKVKYLAFMVDDVCLRVGNTTQETLWNKLAPKR